MTSGQAELRDLIEDARVALVTTVEPDGTLHTRPLATLQYENDRVLWFLTDIDSAKVREVERDMRVSVAYADTEKNSYVAVAGRAEVLQDRAKIEQLWNPMARAWFPDGPTDPGLALLKVNVERAEYWTSPAKAAYVLGAAKSALTGKRTEMGENRKLTM